MPQLRHANVIELADHLPSEENVATRQKMVRNSLCREQGCAAGESPVAYAGVFIDKDGGLKTSALLVEPEHVPAIVEELSILTVKLLAFARDRNVIGLFASVIGLIATAWIDAVYWPALAMMLAN